MLIGWDYLNLIIARKSIHEWEDDTSSAVIDDLINVRCGEIVLWTSSIQIPKIDTNPNGTLFFVDRDIARHPFIQRYEVDKTSLKNFFNLFLNVCCFPQMYLSKFLTNWLGIMVSPNLMNNNGRIYPWYFFVCPRKNISKLFK